MVFCPNCGKAAPAPAKRSGAPVIAACASDVMIPLIVLIAVSSADLGSSHDYTISDRYSNDDYPHRDRDESSDNGGYGGGSVCVPEYTSCLKCHGGRLCPRCNGTGRE